MGGGRPRLQGTERRPVLRVSPEVVTHRADGAPLMID